MLYTCVPSHIQVQHRASSFFHDLCKELVAFVNEVDDMDYVPGSIKRRHGGSLGRNIARISNGSTYCRRSQSFCSISNRANAYENEILEHPVTEQKRRKQDRLHDDSESRKERGLPRAEAESESVNFHICPISGANENSYNSDETLNRQSERPGFGGIMFSNRSDSNFHNEDLDRMVSSKGSKSEGEEWVTFSGGTDEKLGNAINVENDFDKMNGNGNMNSGSNNNSDDDNDQKYRDGIGFCPNVSLSPSLVHRHISSVSSISSGRNSSFDDLDGNPPTIADVLVVSHGGLIKELFKYFSEELDCKLPGGKHVALRICQNCSISKFIVSLSSVSESPSINCIFLNERDHLQGMDEAKGKF